MNEQEPMKVEIMKRAAEPNVAPITAPDEPETYRGGFEGMATQPFSQPAIDILRRPVDPDAVEVKPDGIVYLPGVFYRSRLNEAFGPGAWAMPPRGPARRMPKSGGELVVFNGALFILGRFVAERVGHCMYYPNNAGMTYADAYEGSITDCLSRCCKDIMPGVEVLWEKGWRDEWLREYAHKVDGKWKRIDSKRKRKLSPNATPPTEVPSAGAAAAAANAAPTQSQPRPAPSVNDSPSTASVADTGEIATDEQLDKIEKLIFDDLKWSPDLAKRWLFTTYGTRDPVSLTMKQAANAIEVLPTVIK